MQGKLRDQSMQKRKLKAAHRVAYVIRYTGEHLLKYRDYMWPGLQKGVFPNTSNCINLENRKFVIKKHMKLKLSPAIKLCWCLLLTKSIDYTNLKLRIIKIGKMDVCGRPLFANLVTYISTGIGNLSCFTTFIFPPLYL